MISISVCNAGYYKNGSNCALCGGNTIKLSPGDDTDCDDACDGITEVPNVRRTDCSKFNIFSMVIDSGYQLRMEFQSLKCVIFYKLANAISASFQSAMPVTMEPMDLVRCVLATL